MSNYSASSTAPNVIIVMPNHLPHLDVLDAWEQYLRDVPVIVVQDIGHKPDAPAGYRDVTIVDHSDIDADLGEASWIIPTKSSACRSYGYLLAWRRRPEYILTLDNDCYPDGSDWLRGHVSNLQRNTTLDWVNSENSDGLLYRGFPYTIRDKSEVHLSHGLWSGIPDLDGATWLHNPGVRLGPAAPSALMTIPRWSFFPMCGMNLAWRTDLTPALYFGLFGPAYGFDQYDDIWAGVLVKRVMDHLGLAAVSGAPSVEHRKQSNVFTNLLKQAPGLAMNENFWRVVQSTPLTATDVVGAYRQLISRLPDVIEDEPAGWTAKFKQAALTWLRLFE